MAGELPTNMEETADDFWREVMKAVWHAYDMLDTMSSGTVHVSQLKVITSNIGLKLGIEKAEEVLNKDGATNMDNMDFRSFFDIVKSELIDKQVLPENHEEACLDLGNRLNNIVKTCWTMCKFERRHPCKSFTSDHCLMLWRLFNFLSETDDAGNPETPIKLDPDEAALLLREFIDATGQRNKEDQVKLFVTDSKDFALTFTDFLNVFEKGYVTGLSIKEISHGLNRLYETFILNVLAKGMLWKRGFKVKSWKERYLVLTPMQLRYFVAPDEKVQKGVIEFDSECSVEVPPDRPTHRPNRFIVHTKKKPYEMSAHDLKSKNEWVSALQLALSRAGKDPNIQKEAALERCRARAEKRRLFAEEERKHKEEAELLKKRQEELEEARKKGLEGEELLRKRLDELEEEKRKRLEDEELLKTRQNELDEEKRKREEAEARWQEEQALREAEQERLRELEAIKRELERLLAEERQAKKDEEIVRNLQSKLLEEEFEKREELERLKHQQEEMLKAEREQKAVLESDRREQERLLAEAQARLDQLEHERTAAAEKMQEAVEKLQRAEKDRHVMEEKVKLWKTPVGLARPIQPHPEPLVTHRGLGAFCEKDFVRKEFLAQQQELEKCEEPIKPFQDDDVVETSKEELKEGGRVEVTIEDKILKTETLDVEITTVDNKTLQKDSVSVQNDVDNEAGEKNDLGCAYHSNEGEQNTESDESDSEIEEKCAVNENIDIEDPMNDHGKNESETLGEPEKADDLQETEQNIQLVPITDNDGDENVLDGITDKEKVIENSYDVENNFVKLKELTNDNDNIDSNEMEKNKS